MASHEARLSVWLVGRGFKPVHSSAVGGEVSRSAFDQAWFEVNGFRYPDHLVQGDDDHMEAGFGNDETAGASSSAWLFA